MKAEDIKWKMQTTIVSVAIFRVTSNIFHPAQPFSNRRLEQQMNTTVKSTPTSAVIEFIGNCRGANVQATKNITLLHFFNRQKWK